MLRRAAGGFGAVALSGLLSQLASQTALAGAATSPGINPLAAKPPMFPAKAKSVIFLYMTGGVSHVDTFDYKPKLFADVGKTITVDNWQGKIGQFKRYLKTPQWKFQPGGRCGTRISDLFPQYPRRGRRHLRDQLDGVGPHEPLRSHARHAHRLVHIRPAMHRLVGQLWVGHRKSESSVIHRRCAESSLRRAANLGERFPARLPSGNAHHSRPHANREHPAANLVARAAGDGTRRDRPGERGIIPSSDRATSPWKHRSNRSRPRSACSAKRPRRSISRMRPTPR